MAAPRSAQVTRSRPRLAIVSRRDMWGSAAVHGACPCLQSRVDLSPKRLRQRMTTSDDEEKLREVADQHASDDPAAAAQLYADADYLAQLRKAPGHVNSHEVVDDTQSD